jgi:hypothetical protein
MSLRQILINAQRSHLAGHINKHLANIEVLLTNPAGIGEHQDIQEAIEIELGEIADYHDKLEMLTKFYIQQQIEGDDNATEISK